VVGGVHVQFTGTVDFYTLDIGTRRVLSVPFFVFSRKSRLGGGLGLIKSDGVWRGRE